MNPVAVYAEADALIATLGDRDALIIRDVLDTKMERGEINGPDEYLIQARKFVEYLRSSARQSPAPQSKAPPSAGDRAEADRMLANVAKAPTAEATVPKRATRAPRTGQGISPEVWQSMPDLAYLLYRYAATLADRDGRFTCTRAAAMKALRASDGGIGTAIRLHVRAGVWDRIKPGRWRQKGRKRPKQTVYRLVTDFDQAGAVQAYQGYREAGKAALRRLAEKRKAARASTVPVTSLTVPVPCPL